MPKIIVKPVTNPVQLRQRAQKSYTVRRTGAWVDPFPSVPGTQIEKMVYAALMFRGIQFQFQEWLQVDIAGLASNSWYRPDFMIPSIKTIIQVQGTYWHSQPDRIQQDSFEAALFELAGWTVLFWWDYEIFDHLDNLIAGSIVNSAARGTPLPHQARWYNDLAGLRKKNAERYQAYKHKPTKQKFRHKIKRPKKVYGRTRGLF